MSQLQEYTDSENKVFGVIIICNQGDASIIQSHHSDWFIPIHSIHDSSSSIVDIESVVEKTWSNERKEYRLILVHEDCCNEIVKLDEQFLSAHGIAVIRFSGKVPPVCDIVKHVYQVPRTLSGKQQRVTFIRPIESNDNKMCVWHRPSSRLGSFKEFHVAHGITDIVCLLNEKEGSSKYGDFAETCSITFHKFPLAGAQINYLSSSDTRSLLLSYAKTIVDVIRSDHHQKKILIHCSAGCHRTGTFAYLVLRLLEIDPERAKAALILMRRETGAEVGAARIEFVEDLIKNS